MKLEVHPDGTTASNLKLLLYSPPVDATKSDDYEPLFGITRAFADTVMVSAPAMHPLGGRSDAETRSILPSIDMSV